MGHTVVVVPVVVVVVVVVVDVVVVLDMVVIAVLVVVGAVIDKSFKHNICFKSKWHMLNYLKIACKLEIDLLAHFVIRSKSLIPKFYCIFVTFLGFLQ